MIRGDLDRRGGDQPDPLALVEVQLGQRAGAGPDPVGHRLVEDLLAELLELGHGVAGDEGQRGGAGLGDVLGVLDADDPEVGLLPGRAEDLAGGEELAAVQPAGEVEDARALHHVLSTSKNAAAAGSAGVASAVSTSAAAAAASPASAERCWRFSSRRLFSGVTRAAYRAASDPARSRAAAARASCGRSACLRCGSIAAMPSTHDVSALVAEAAADRPDALALVEAGGRSVTWAELEDEVARSPPVSARRARGRPAGDDRGGQPDRVRHGLPRRAARPGRRRPGQPARRPPVSWPG